MAGAAVAERVTGEGADHAAEAGRIGQRRAQPGAVDVEGIATCNSDLLDGAQENRGGVVGVGHIDGRGRLIVLFLVGGDEVATAPAGRLIDVMLEMQLRAGEVEALRFRYGEQFEVQQRRAANQGQPIK